MRSSFLSFSKIAIVSVFTSQLLFGQVNTTWTFSQLKSGKWGDDGYVNGWSGYSTYTYTPTFDFGSHTLTFAGRNSPSWGAGGGYIGTQNVTINASKVIFNPKSLLQIGNNVHSNSATVTFNAPVQMGAESLINVKSNSHLVLNQGLTGSGSVSVDGTLYAKNANKPFELSDLYLGNSTEIFSSSFSASKITLYEGVTLNLLGVKGDLNINTFTTSHSGLLSNYTSTIDTHSNTTVGTIDISNYGGGRTAFVNTHGYGDITITGDLKVRGSIGGNGLAGSTAMFRLNGKNITLKKDVSIGYYSKLLVSGVGDFTAQNITLSGGVLKGGNSILDFSAIQGKTDIAGLYLTTASVYGQNFHIGSLTAYKGNSYIAFYSNIKNSSIDNLSISQGGSNVDHAELDFTGGGDSLTIDSADIHSWGVLDASKISQVTIKNLSSSYATIKAGNLTLNNATFSNNETYLEANTTTQKDGKFTLDNGAKLYIKKGVSFSADTLDMYNGSALYASNTNGGGMSGSTTINNIIFSNSQIYANNLNTNNITVKNNASVFLTKGSTYTNTGDLNIDDGTFLQIHGGNFINNGELNVSLGSDSSKNAKNLIDVLDGSFTFNMTMTKQNAQDAQGNTIQVDVPKAKINVNVSLVGLSAGQTYNLLKTRDGIWFNDGSKIYKNGDSGYDDLAKLLQNRMSFNSPDGYSLALDYFLSADRKSIGFKYDTGKHYVNAIPYVQPGTWVLGIGSGAAAFGHIGGVPAASGLAKSYTVRLQKQNWTNTITGKVENTIYYMLNLDYHNYGNTGAVFTVDATGSDFALGKNQDVGGAEGTVTIGTNTMKSHMVVKADNIYLGGKITLGDSALISGHLNLQSAGNIFGDNKASVINIRNHSSLKASGTSFKYAGTILLNANATVTDEVGIDLSGISGPIEIGAMEARAARPNSIDTNAGIKMKNFKIGSLTVWNGNGGTINNYYSSFATNIGTSSIETLALKKGTSGLDQSGLRFSGGGDSLTIGTAQIGSWSYLDASKITDVTITKLIDLPYAPNITYDGGVHGVTFNNLTLGEGAEMRYGGSSDLTIKGNFTLKNNGFISIAPDKNIIKTINVGGNATFYFNDEKSSSDGTPTPLIKVSNIKGLKLNQDYVIFKAGGSITYIYVNSEGKELKSTDSKDAANTLYNEVEDRVAFYDGGDTTTRSKGDIEVKANDKQISFKVNELDNSNPYDPNDIRYWFYKRGGANWVSTIEDISTTTVQVTDKTTKKTENVPSVIAWLNQLMIDKHNGLWAKQRVYDNDLNYFVRTAKELESTMGQLSSVNRKNNSTNSVRLATDVNRTSRLVKLSNTQANTPTFAEVIRGLEKQHFAVNGNSISSIYKFSNRNSYKNNLWATVIGAASFVEGGNSTLYGVNIGYDRFINNVIVGGYVAYAQGKYTGDIIRNQSYNANVGFYSRAYVGNNEFDISASGTYGYNKESLYSQDIILSLLNQNYNYNTFTGNVNFNYGYVFGISNKSIVLKPQIGISAYYICASGNWYCGKRGAIQGNVDSAGDEDLAIDANADNKFNVAINIALETRQYFNGNSYWYFIAGVSRDVLLLSKGDKEVRFIGANTLSYKKGDQLNTYGSLTAGGELELFKRIYVNLGLGAKAGFAYKDININGSVGMRYVF